MPHIRLSVKATRTSVPCARMKSACPGSVTTCTEQYCRTQCCWTFHWYSLQETHTMATAAGLAGLRTGIAWSDVLTCAPSGACHTHLLELVIARPVHPGWHESTESSWAHVQAEALQRDGPATRPCHVQAAAAQLLPEPAAARAVRQALVRNLAARQHARKRSLREPQRRQPTQHPARACRAAARS